MPTVRRATREDVRAAEEVRIRTWQSAYRGVVPDAVLDGLSVTPDRVALLLRRYDGGESVTWVAVDGDKVVGMAVVGPCRDEDRPDAHELYALYVLPSYWGSGVGQALWEAAQPFSSLWVLEDNPRARAFYARNGYLPDRTQVVDVGVVLPEVRYVAGASRG